MESNSRAETEKSPGEPEFDRNAELRAFDETKSGVKGLVDSGITQIPRIFIHRKPNQPEKKASVDEDRGTLPKFPIIDLDGVLTSSIKRREIVDSVRDASENWGFFQVTNHGIPASVLEELIGGVRRFHEQDDEVKKKWYTRDPVKKFVYNSNFDLYTSPAANWRDSMYCVMAPNIPTPEDLPEAVVYLYISSLQYIQ